MAGAYDYGKKLGTGRYGYLLSKGIPPTSIIRSIEVSI